MRQIDHFLNGAAVAATSGRKSDVFDPNTGEVQAQVGLASEADVDQAVALAASVQPEWAALNPQRRARVMFEFKRLIERDMDKLAHALSAEHGKVIADAKGDVQRGLEVIEFVCAIPHLLKGEYTEGAGPGIDVFSMRQPLGVVAGITRSTSRDDPAVDVRPRTGHRQCLHPQAVGTRSFGAQHAGRAVHRGGRPGRPVQCGAW
jgi:malonate-semialdehyde dehydrogenase (acetylating)/methylmalonate-semialdehyde dehydrogenase